MNCIRVKEFSMMVFALVVVSLMLVRHALWQAIAQAAVDSL
jgi:hypothetical protein